MIKVFFFIFLFTVKAFGIMDTVNLGIRDINIYGIFEGSADNLNSINCNPSSIIHNLSGDYFGINLTTQFVKDRNSYFLPYSFVIAGNIPQSLFYFGIGNLQYNYANFFDNSESEVNKISFTIALPDNISGTSFNLGLSINYYYIIREIEGYSIKGDSFSVDWGIMKNFNNKYGIGFAWQSRSRINWEKNTILDNEITSSFIFHTFLKLRTLNFILAWVHIFDTNHRSKGESTKNLVLRKSENRLYLGIILNIVSNIKLKFGIYNINNFYNENIIDKESIQFVSYIGSSFEFENFSFNMSYQDSSLINSPKGYESERNFNRIIISIGYSFSKGK